VLSFSLTAEGFFGCCTGGSKANEFRLVGETTAQALSPTEMAAKSKRDTFIQFKTSGNRAASARAVKRMIVRVMRFLEPPAREYSTIGSWNTDIRRGHRELLCQARVAIQ
jgi:hypothetical protein